MKRWQPKPGPRLYQDRYTGLRRQIARANSWHPIKDRSKIEELMPQVLEMAKQAKQKIPRMRYRNVEVTPTGLTVTLLRDGPE